MILENLSSYISMQRYHIHREDSVFYPLAQEAFSESEQQDLLNRFKNEEQKVGRTAFESSRVVISRLSSLLGNGNSPAY